MNDMGTDIEQPEHVHSQTALRFGAALRTVWWQTAIVILSVAGLLISIYLTSVHYEHVPLVCSTTGFINCQRVTSSPYSVVPGTTIPITIPGMLWFIVSGSIALFSLRAFAVNGIDSRRLRIFQLFWSLFGIAFVLYLIYAEFVLLHNLCEWCTAIHIATFIILIASAYHWQNAKDAALPASNREHQDEYGSAQYTSAQLAMMRRKHKH